MAICASAQVMSQIPHMDVTHYRFELRVTDAHDTIQMKETIDFSWKDKTKLPCLNLVSKQKNGKGMQVKSVSKNG